ncbi:cold shock-like protein CspF [Escherichia coli]|uniref:cold shock-like protein CspF n=1 Tax=Escherichia coli TaxID=562 RepID=UPI000BE13D32|nr:cold shock-like protein CspF [Escherichia coli]MBE9700404.1 cold shock-like protein CspF [Escherichia coli]MDI0486957.1 cold shock-like protein CspF [Escherichia coli]MDI0546270.1 cold shock-like protein CspF [Escherichia coli]MDI0551383.1 cold shock-like protein CspF [Escherichia coli]MDI0653017.1 cold shock-like protein CspF [Escherichia coli]
MSRKMTGIVKTFDGKSGKGLITPSDGRIDAQLHVSALNLRDAEEITTGLRVEFCRINGLRGPSAANVYLS